MTRVDGEARPDGDVEVAESADSAASAGATSTHEATPSGRGLRSWFDRMPLSALLVGITVVLLGTGIAFAGLAARAVVSGYLVDQLDDQLRQSAYNVAWVGLRAEDPSSAVPSTYVVQLRDADGSVFGPIAWSRTIEELGVPDLPEESVDAAVRHAGQPFTVDSTGGTDPSHWRMVAVPYAVPDRPAPSGVAYVALPMGAVDKTVKHLSRSLVLSGLGIILLGGGAAWLLVNRSLRPLRRIEATAASIAEGDLSRRVPDLPPTTEVGSLSSSLNAMLSQIESAFAAQEASEQRMRRFVSDASHELRTPLATIKGYGELYRMGALDDAAKVDDTMGRIEDSAQRMGTLVNDLLVLARIDEGRPMRREPVDLVSLVRDAAQDLHALDPTRTVSVTGLGPGEEPPASEIVTGDADRLRQVLTNLVGNVARYTPAGSPAELAVGRSDGQAVVEVRDHGPGVAAEHAGAIFERFYRADTSRTRASGGSGLGLAIVAAILGAHGGRASVHDTAGGGLTARVQLPVAQEYDA